MEIKWGSGFSKFGDRKQAAKLAFDLAEKKYIVTVTYDGVYYIVNHKPEGE